MANEWDHLPNAKHIDAILADVNANPERWKVAGPSARDVAWNAAWIVAWEVGWEVGWASAARGAASAAARGAIVALVAWDESSKYLEMTVDELKVWYALSNDPAALLLLPAVMVMNKELVNE